MACAGWVGEEKHSSQEKLVLGCGQYAGPSEHSPLWPLEKAPTFLPQEKRKSEAVHDSKL